MPGRLGIVERLTISGPLPGERGGAGYCSPAPLQFLPPPVQSWPMADLPALLDSIRENPGSQARWLALSWWLWAHEREDEAAVVRVFWPMLRDRMTQDGWSLEATLADLERNAKVLADVARQVEERARSPAEWPRAGPT